MTPHHLDPDDRTGGKQKAFVADYERRFGCAPDVWATLAYDATMLAVEAIAAHDGDRTAIRDHLARIRTKEDAFEGVAGRTYFDADGNCLRPMRFVRVQKRAFVLAPRQLD